MSPFSRHTSYSLLADYADKKLAPAEQATVEVHVAECRHCAQQLAVLAKMMRLMRQDATPRASTEAFLWVTNLIRTQGLAAGAAQSTLKRVLAVLRSELAPFKPVFGERSAPGATRQLFYEADVNVLDLQITPRQQGLGIAGQVMGPCEPGEVELTGKEGSTRAPLTDSGEFELSPAAEGVYQLWVRWPGVEIEVPEFTLKQ